MLVKINENKLKLLFSKMLEEDIKKVPSFGNGRRSIDYSGVFKELEKVPNLHNDRYKDYELEDAWNNWKKVGYDKNTQEYLIYVSKFKNFMFGSGGFLRNLSYVTDRVNGPLHSLLLDFQWSASLVRTKDWRYSDLNSGQGGDEFHCFYTTILKLFQNPIL